MTSSLLALLDSATNDRFRIEKCLNALLCGALRENAIQERFVDQATTTLLDLTLVQPRTLRYQFKAGLVIEFEQDKPRDRCHIRVFTHGILVEEGAFRRRSFLGVTHQEVFMFYFGE